MGQRIPHVLCQVAVIGAAGAEFKEDALKQLRQLRPSITKVRVGKGDSRLDFFLYTTWKSEGETAIPPPPSSFPFFFRLISPCSSSATTDTTFHSTASKVPTDNVSLFLFFFRKKSWRGERGQSFPLFSHSENYTTSSMYVHSM